MTFKYDNSRPRNNDRRCCGGYSGSRSRINVGKVNQGHPVARWRFLAIRVLSSFAVQGCRGRAGTPVVLQASSAIHLRLEIDSCRAGRWAYDLQNYLASPKSYACRMESRIQVQAGASLQKPRKFD